VATTIRDVAHRAGVSIATVSRALRDATSVTPETRARVTQAAADLEYVPSQLGRQLAQGRHAANGIVFPDLSGPYYAEVVLGYESVTAAVGRSVIILSTHGRERVRDLVLDLAARVDGLVVFGRTVDDDLIGHIVATGPPVVLVARPRVDGADAVNAENVDTARELTEHLLADGHHTFAFLGDPDASTDFLERWQGLRDGLAAAGHSAPALVTCGFDERSGHETAKPLLSPTGAGAIRPDVLVCGNDQIALGAIEATGELGLRVPQDVAVTGWDDVMAARYAALTTVRQPMRELGARAAHALDERLSQGRTEPITDVLPTQLVIRTSCGPHRTGGQT
jgi:LacI family transcriptional regulator, galactose operon repressor